MNATNKTSKIQWQIFLNLSAEEIIIETFIFSLVGAISIVGNFLVIASVYRNQSLRTSTNYLAVSLAITDILYPITVVSFSIFFLNDLKIPDFIYGQAVCDFQTICFFTLINTSLYTITLMAYNRFVCVCKQDKYKQIFTKRNTLCMIVSLWMICVTIAIFLVKGGISNAKFFPSITMCSLSRSTKVQYLRYIGNGLLIVAIGVPYSITCYFYAKIIKKIQQHKTRIAQNNSGVLGNQEIKITWTLFAVLLGYALLWLPAVITGVIRSNNNNIPHFVSSIIPLGTACSSAVNPFIYAFMNIEFRREFIRFLTCK